MQAFTASLRHFREGGNDGRGEKATPEKVMRLPGPSRIDNKM